MVYYRAWELKLVTSAALAQELPLVVQQEVERAENDKPRTGTLHYALLALAEGMERFPEIARPGGKYLGAIDWLVEQLAGHLAAGRIEDEPDQRLKHALAAIRERAKSIEGLEMIHRLFAFALTLFICLQLAGAQTNYASNIASLIDPAKLATLGKRRANPRVQKCVYWLAEARSKGQEPSAVLDDAIARAGIHSGLVAKLSKDAFLRNLSIAQKLGCLDDEGLSEMRRGRAATVRRGPYTGDQLSVDHIIPRDPLPIPSEALHSVLGDVLPKAQAPLRSANRLMRRPSFFSNGPLTLGNSGLASAARRRR